MKTVCDFCKTEYSLDNAPSGAVKCAICGHTWTPAGRPRQNGLLMVIAATCALLSAIVFSAAVITRHQIEQRNTPPLVATVSSVDSVTDNDGTSRIVVRGAVHNTSAQIYGVPDLIIVGMDADGKTIASQKFMPSVTLLDSGASADFEHTLTMPLHGVKQISAVLQLPDNDKGDEKK